MTNETSEKNLEKKAINTNPEMEIYQHSSEKEFYHTPKKEKKTFYNTKKEISDSQELNDYNSRK